MTIPSSYTFTTKNGQRFDWWLQDSELLTPITGATVTASLYYGRSRQDPDAIPGVVDPNFNGISFASIGSGQPPCGSGTAQQYRATILAVFDPPSNDPNPTPYGGGYILVVDATAAGYQPMHWEVPSVVTPRVS